MQGNGFKLSIIAAFFALTLFYLYPTIIWNLEQRQMSTFTEEERTQYEMDNAEKLSTLKENILSLGLDLQGGMHVTLEAVSYTHLTLPTICSV